MTAVTRVRHESDTSGEVHRCQTRVTLGAQKPKGTVSARGCASDDAQVFDPWGPGDVFRSGLREIMAARAALDRLESELVVGARGRGYKWRELGEDLGLSAHGVRKRHVAVDPIHAWKVQRTLDEHAGRLP